MRAWGVGPPLFLILLFIHKNPDTGLGDSPGCLVSASLDAGIPVRSFGSVPGQGLFPFFPIV